MRNETPGHTLQATALVHEALLKLIKTSSLDDVRNQDHFQALVISAMRQVLVDHARSRNALKRNGGLQKVEFRDAVVMAMDSPDDFLAIDEVLTKLRDIDPLKARIFELRFLFGCTRGEVAAALGLSLDQVKSALDVTRAWIRREMSKVRDG